MPVCGSQVWPVKKRRNYLLRKRVSTERRSGVTGIMRTAHSDSADRMVSARPLLAFVAARAQGKFMFTEQTATFAATKTGLQR